MKPLRISDSETIILALQDEIRRSWEARYDHRLHALLLVAHGVTCPEVARLLGDSPRAIEYWVRRFEEEGLSGLADGVRTGRPSRLSAEQIEEIGTYLRLPPDAAGIMGNVWDGKMLSSFIASRYGIDVGVRQCQRLFRELGFRLRKPRPMIAHADPALQEEYKKTHIADAR